MREGIFEKSLIEVLGALLSLIQVFLGAFSILQSL